MNTGPTFRSLAGNKCKRFLGVALPVTQESSVTMGGVLAEFKGGIATIVPEHDLKPTTDLFVTVNPLLAVTEDIRLSSTILVGKNPELLIAGLDELEVELVLESMPDLFTVRALR
ncbi:hypothetical protein DRO61_07150 [Candidatus Bathyarchaeota archaeon]|nr:MAG: hypothetical protein DRO61_07150 [Candidatus Bathyarchaeota archaeon]